jgi:hypothetical protein
MEHTNGTNGHIAHALNGNGHYMSPVTPEDRRGPLQYYCEESSRFEKICSLIIVAIIAAGVWGAFLPKPPPEPPTAEEQVKIEQLGKIDAAIEALQNVRDEIDPPAEPDPTDEHDWP